MVAEKPSKKTVKDMAQEGDIKFKQTKIGKIPEDWSFTNIGSVASLSSGSTPLRSNPSYFCNVGGYAWVKTMNLTGSNVYETDERITDLGLHQTSCRLNPPGTIMIAMYGGFNQIGRTGILQIEAATNQAICCINVDKNKVDPDYCNIWLTANRWRWKNIAASSRKDPNITKEDVRAFPIVLPPLPKQKKIAAILSSVDEAIAKTQAVIDQTRKVKQGLLQQLLTRGIGHTKFKNSAIGKIPESWEVVRLLEHITLASGQVDPKQSPYKELPLIAPNHIESGTGRLLETVSAEAQGAISGKYLFKAEDVIYSKIRPYLRKAILATEQGLCSADMYPLRVKNKILPGFLLAIILSEDFSRFADSKSMRTGIPKLNREELGEYFCALPSINEQKKIVSILKSIDQDIEANLQNFKNLEIIKCGLMQDLLTGRVRVKGASPSI